MRAWRTALREMPWLTIAALWLGTLLLAALGALWLQIPDSHLWQFALSMVTAAAWLVLLLWFKCWIAARLLRPGEPAPWWMRWLLVAAVIAAWWLLQIPIDRLADREELYAGYWVSRLPHWLRGLHSYEHLLQLQQWACLGLRVIAAGLLLPVGLAAGAGVLRSRMRPVLRTWLRWWYWLPLILAAWIGVAVTGRLVSWTPAHGLAREILSLTLRLGFAFTLCALLLGLVLSVTTVSLRDDATSAGQ